MRSKYVGRQDSVPLVPIVGTNNACYGAYNDEEPQEEQQGRKTFIEENIKIRQYVDENENIIQDEYFLDEKLQKHYKVVSADCYGTLNFKELSQCLSSKFIRFSEPNTKPEALYQLMVDHWKVKAPTLLISVTGGAKSFSISPRLKRDFLGGLRKVASTPGAWVISGGTDTGVMKMVGDANRGIENISVGVVTWGVLANKEMLTMDADKGRLSDGIYSYDLGSYLNLPTGLSYLDAHHTHFLLVDDGTVENWGVEIEFRGNFEKCIMTEAKEGQQQRIPTVLLVLEGGPGTLKTVHNAVKSKIPCVLVKGSGRATDMLVYAIDNADRIKGENKHVGLKGEIRKLVGERAPHDSRTEDDTINRLYEIIEECIKEKNIFTIVDQESGLDTDNAILTALLNDPNTSTSDYDKLRFTLYWDRVDLAEEKVLSPMNQWKSRGYEDKDKDKEGEREKEGAAGRKELERLLISALAMNNVRFVELLIDYGVSVRSLLTRQVLEILYAYCSPSALSEDQESKCRKTPVDGLSEDDEKFFLSLSRDDHRNSAQQAEGIRKIDLSVIKENCLYNILEDVPREYLRSVIEIPEEAKSLFDTPYRQLFVWSVFNNFRDMAIYLWQFVEDSMATALFASTIAYSMRKNLHAGLRNVQDTEEKEWTDSLNTYTRLSFDLLETCHKNNEIDTVVLVTKETSFFDSKCSTLDFAFATDQKDFIAHRAIQEILDDEWYGSIKSEHGQLRIIATIFLPFLLIWGMDIRKKDEHVQGDQNIQCQSTVGTNQASFIKKLLYFHTESPNVRFLEHTIGYILFLVLFSSVAIAKRSTNFDWTEILLVITVIGYVFHEAYQMLHMDAPKLRTKIVKYFFNFWNIFDLLCIILFFIALAFRCRTSSLGVGHLLYAMDVGLWIVRIIHILYADPISGPYVILIGKMSKDIMHFLIILVIFVFSYAVSVRAILEQGTLNGNKLAPVYRPYFHLFGELFLEEHDDDNKTIFNTSKQNAYAEPIALVYLGVYILIANILLLNLLIAIFNSTYERVMATASRTWKFQRYQLIVEYAHQRTFFCPPLNLIELMGRLVRYFKDHCTERKRSSVLRVRRMTNRKPGEEEEALCCLERHSVSKVLHKRKEIESVEKGGDSGGVSMTKSELEKKFVEQTDNYETLSEKNERSMALMQKIEVKVEDLEKKLKEQERKEEKGGESGGVSMTKNELAKKFVEQTDNYETLSEKNERNMTLMQKIEGKVEELEKKFKEQEERQERNILLLLEKVDKLLDKQLEATP